MQSNVEVHHMLALSCQVSKCQLLSREYEVRLRGLGLHKVGRCQSTQG